MSAATKTGNRQASTFAKELGLELEQIGRVLGMEVKARTPLTPVKQKQVRDAMDPGGRVSYPETSKNGNGEESDDQPAGQSDSSDAEKPKPARKDTRKRRPRVGASHRVSTQLKAVLQTVQDWADGFGVPRGWKPANDPDGAGTNKVQLNDHKGVRRTMGAVQYMRCLNGHERWPWERMPKKSEVEDMAASIVKALVTGSYLCEVCNQSIDENAAAVSQVWQAVNGEGAFEHTRQARGANLMGRYPIKLAKAHTPCRFIEQRIQPFVTSGQAPSLDELVGEVGEITKMVNLDIADKNSRIRDEERHLPLMTELEVLDYLEAAWNYMLGVN